MMTVHLYIRHLPLLLHQCERLRYLLPLQLQLQFGPLFSQMCIQVLVVSADSVPCTSCTRRVTCQRRAASNEQLHARDD